MDRGNDCLVSVDCVDFEVTKPRPFIEELNKKWFSYKFHGAGYCYEIAVSIIPGDIVSVKGPYKCGEFNDADIFQMDLIDCLDPFERIEADRGYAALDPTYAKTPDGGYISRTT